MKIYKVTYDETSTPDQYYSERSDIVLPTDAKLMWKDDGEEKYVFDSLSKDDPLNCLDWSGISMTATITIKIIEL